jgi:hypothetical protein
VATATSRTSDRREQPTDLIGIGNDPAVDGLGHFGSPPLHPIYRIEIQQP